MVLLHVGRRPLVFQFLVKLQKPITNVSTYSADNKQKNGLCDNGRRLSQLFREIGVQSGPKILFCQAGISRNSVL